MADKIFSSFHYTSLHLIQFHFSQSQFILNFGFQFTFGGAPDSVGLSNGVLGPNSDPDPDPAPSAAALFSIPSPDSSSFDLLLLPLVDPHGVAPLGFLLFWGVALTDLLSPSITKC